MASKSKRRRRVFRASCILAALIIAGSSFAWFTSSDEVTNRLSANADYDVKIVESFSPTKNWLPEQEVDKDVFAVNTGSIGAFVEEDVTSRMTLTQEKEVANFDSTKKDDYVKLTPAERYSVEAGAYLAYVKPDGSGVTQKKLGMKVVSFVDNASKPKTLEDYEPDTVLTDFSPDVAGLYVFRRSIDVKSDGTEEFEYQAYYFDGTDYYKVKLTSVTQDTEVDKANDNKDNDGNLTDATVKYFTETTGTYTPTLKYLDDGINKWLIATVPGTDATGIDLSDLGDKYDKALHDYEVALAALDRAVAEDDTATAEEKSTLNAYNAAQLAKQAAEKAYNEALANLNATRSQLAAAIADRDNATNGVKDKRDAALQELYGDITYSSSTVYTDGSGNPVTTLTENTDYKDGLFKTMLTEFGDVEATTPSVKEDFFNDLKTYASTANGGSPITGYNVSNFTSYNETKLNELIALFSYDQLHAYTVTRAADNHDTYKELGEYYAAKKAYETKLAEFKALDASLTELNNRIGDANSGLIQQFNSQYDDVYGATARAAYSDTTYATAVSKAGVDDSTTDITSANAASKKSLYASRENGDKYGALLYAIANEFVTKAAYDTAHANASAASTGTAAHRTAAEQAAQAAKYALDAAKQAYEDGQKAVQGAGDIKINIKLSNAVTTQGGTKDQWQILPSTVAGNVAKFYYTGILLGGETSSQLIDSVTLDKSVTQDMYKSFDFDLDVALKSAQITYAADNETIKTDATGSLSATPTLSTPTDIETAINWT